MRRLLGLQVLFLLVGLGCNKTRDPEYAIAPANSDAETLQITWQVPDAALTGEEKQYLKDGGKSWYADLLESAFNVDFEFVLSGWEWDIYAELYLYPGEWTGVDGIPDCAFLSFARMRQDDTFDCLETMHARGLIRSIPESLIRKHMPRYAEYVDHTVVDGWKQMRPVDGDLSAYRGLLSVDIVRALAVEGVSTYVGWAERAGFTFPNYGKKRRLIVQPATYWLEEDISLESWESLLGQYLVCDPDGNGKNDTIPWPGASDPFDRWWCAGIRGCTGDVEGPILERGELTMGEISEGFRRYCTLLQRWYRKGLIDKYFGTESTKHYTDMYSQGRMGGSPFTFASNTPLPTRLGSRKDKQPQEIVVVPPLVGLDGERGLYASKSVRDFFLVVSPKVGDDKLARILQIWELLNFGRNEDFIYSRHGSPGVHFTWSGEPTRSQPRRKDLDDTRGTVAKLGRFPGYLPRGWRAEDLLLQYPEPLGAFLADRGLDAGALAQIHRPCVNTYVADEYVAAVEKKHLNKLTKLAYQFLVRVVQTGADIDALWKDYRETWLFSGGRELIDAYKRLPPKEDSPPAGLLIW